MIMHFWKVHNMKSAFYRLPIFLLAFSIIFVSGYSELRAFEKYKSGLVKSALEKGQTVFIEYYAPWCPVCKTQARVMKDLLSNNPE